MCRCAQRRQLAGSASRAVVKGDLKTAVRQIKMFGGTVQRDIAAAQAAAKRLLPGRR